ncbi:LysR family transcriptional regulator [Thermomonospora cellulosilytica]|uniref:DNA-binding transcriptional LysR family regulator n=1 Tax=Thermomonospora cellulosilytica TaxID=1411118 RepID=A0A7W3N468_9ACTN|nr:LysR family transcriptional regulator [Thermomonospora cellulosilytica]MBA9007220.1 DNA-binding transcriptional LysR family regulator [Thermomonospora cellulosilytica]
MNLAQLRALRAVHEAGSVTGAAELLDVTQSAVSHALNSLENELGLRLVVRERTGCRLTEVGRRLIPHAAEALRHVDRFAEEAAAAAGLVTGRLGIGAFPSAHRVLPAFVREFRRLHPAVEVLLWEGTDDEVNEWIERRVVELGVVCGLRPDLHTVPFANDEFLAVLPADHPLAGEPAVSLADLEDDPFLLSGAGCEPLLRDLYRSRGLSLAPAHRVHTMSTLLAMVRENVGVSVIPSLALDERRDGIAAVPLRPPAPRSLLLAARSEQDLSPAARAFLTTIPDGGVTLTAPAEHASAVL